MISWVVAFLSWVSLSGPVVENVQVEEPSDLDDSRMYRPTPSESSFCTNDPSMSLSGELTRRAKGGSISSLNACAIKHGKVSVAQTADMVSLMKSFISQG
jgi:hypothetical protein